MNTIPAPSTPIPTADLAADTPAADVPSGDDSPVGLQTISPAQLAANRCNAKQSTGPKTRVGKARAKRNAIKHGLLARTVVIRGHQLKESNYEFRALCRALYADLNPVGQLEEMLVGQIGTATWRLHRARTAESGEIALSVDQGHWERRHVNAQMQWTLWRAAGDPISAMQASLCGSSILVKWLHKVRAQVEQAGELTDDALKILYFGEPNSLTQELETLRRQNPLPAEADAGQRAEVKARLLQEIDKKLRQLERSQENCRQHEESEEQANQAAAVLPDEATLNKILRYETALERQLYQAMHQLERLQRRREGENIPAPMTLDVSAKD